MNNKRQTIWLVSMLSLMVILSAYYLFTEDVAPSDNASGTEQSETLGAAKASTNPDGVEITEVDTITGEATGQETGGKNSEAASGEDLSAGAKESAGLSPEDQEVLKEMTNLKGMQLLDQLQLERRENVSQKYADLNTIISDTKNHSPDEATSAAEELGRLEDADLRITSLEEKLLQDYENAVVTEENANYKVIVLSDKLEKKQAVTILDMATKELNVTPDRVSVQVVQ